MKFSFTIVIYLLRSGVSILKVEGEGNFVRIGGTATGGGTFWGLGKLLTSANDFDELLDLASKGDHTNVDLLIKDIYGEGKHNLDLGPEVIASTFGKLIWNVDKSKFSEADLARSLLFLISNDICQIASLYALLHQVKTIYFGGFFIRHHPLSMHSIDYSVNFWTKGMVRAKFLRHEGYLGAIGAFLKGAEELQTSNYSWTENYFGSTSLSWKSSNANTINIPHNLEIDRFERILYHCPLLEDPKNYIPDTVDLSRDSDAREYWLKCFEESLGKFANRAEQSEEALDQETEKKIKARSRRFQEEYLKKLKDFSTRPFAFGNLTVRNLLDLREHCLREFGFQDPYLKQKTLENDQAFELFEALLYQIEGMKPVDAHETLARGILAGNVFDWGAKEVAVMMESDKGLDFDMALSFIGPRPWLVDDLDPWLERMNKKPHKCAVIFIDNSGVDIVLGILPFVIYLLKRGTEVILCANNRPVLNDVTFRELNEILNRASKISHIIKESLEKGTLHPVDSGQGSPCLDLSRLNEDLVKLILEKQVDLMVLEGMGRAVHTNLNAKFNCEVLKIAVLKNVWLANKLGGSMFSVVFKYEVPDDN
ncbi:4'-phosphopantetheine phosphatase isoform X2 [Lepeophtheirus salmonis]|uniref:4'-phosphopantetheine phosphatase isoform X2 n=1 Tax=Lepeophtheirus salmonis TaxID=72036 RepID=UPI001AE97280|nr:4'-phosphopantetheine phosphatase-like isoform X2 [Lepeophtheirus salmonis]